MSADLEELTPSNCALMLIDHQTHLFVRWPDTDFAALKRNALCLASLAKIFELPLILSAVRKGRNTPSGPFLPEIERMFPSHPVLYHTKLNCWNDPASREAVRATGRKKLIMAGLAADFGVVLPALHARAAGYDVRVALDPSGAWNPLIGTAAVARLSSGGVVPTHFVAIAGELQGDWDDEKTARPLLELLKLNLVHWASKDAHSRLKRSTSTVAKLGQLFDF